MTSVTATSVRAETSGFRAALPQLAPFAGVFAVAMILPFVSNDYWALIGTRAGDLLGSWIYNSSPTRGFTYCVIATTVVYALILPLILLVPKKLIATKDGEPNPEVEAEVLAEVAAT